MCRLLGVVSRAQKPLGDLLSDELPAFTDLSREHADGWGIASWQDERLDIRKEPTPAHASAEYLAAVRGLETDAALLHIRLANPGSPLILDNTHPFETATVAFAHNGDFHPFDAVDDLLDPALLASAQGSTDSERFFLLIQRWMAEGDPVSAVVRAAAEIRGRARWSGLNCLLLTRDALLAYSDHDPSSAVATRRGPEYFPMNYRVDADRVVVASTGWDQKAPEWTRLDERHVLEVRRSDLRVSRHLVPERVPAG